MESIVPCASFHGNSAICQRGSPAPTPDCSLGFSHHARQRCGPFRFRNVRRRGVLDRFHSNNRKRAEAERITLARDGPTRCKSQSTPRNRPLPARGGDFGECPQTDFGARLRSTYANSISGRARFEFLPRRTNRVCRQRRSLARRAPFATVWIRPNDSVHQEIIRLVSLSFRLRNKIATVFSTSIYSTKMKSFRCETRKRAGRNRLNRFGSKSLGRILICFRYEARVSRPQRRLLYGFA